MGNQNSDLRTLGLITNDLIPIESLVGVQKYEQVIRIRKESLLKHSICSVLKKPILYHDRVLSAIINLRSIIKNDFKVKGNGKPIFLVRVDDFPRFDLFLEDFLRFHYKMSTNEIPYLLGVTPFPSKRPFDVGIQNLEKLKPEDWSALAELRNSGVEIAMHGVTHQTVSSFRNSEIVGVPKTVLDERLSLGLKELESNNVKTDIFIPPFNSFDLNSAETLSKYFRVLCGGPESVMYVGPKLSPSFFNNMLYLPSYYPAYGLAKDIIPFVEQVKLLNEPVVVPLTLHWGWEFNKGYSDMDAFCKSIRGHVTSWKEYISSAL